MYAAPVHPLHRAFELSCACAADTFREAAAVARQAEVPDLQLLLAYAELSAVLQVLPAAGCAAAHAMLRHYLRLCV